MPTTHAPSATSSAASDTSRHGPAWDNSREYAGLGSAGFADDFAKVRGLTQQLSDLSSRLAPLIPAAGSLAGDAGTAAVELAQGATRLYENAAALLRNLETFVTCELSVDGRNADGKTWSSKLAKAAAALAQANNAVQQFLLHAADPLAAAYLAADDIAPHTFTVMQDRRFKDFELPLGEEDLIIGLGVDGHTAWETLYDNLSGSIACTLQLAGQTRQVGLAEAASLLQDPDRSTREGAFRAISRGWEVHEEAVAQVLNSLSGWRLELGRRRSLKKPRHFLDAPLQAGRIERATLDAMMGAVKSARPFARDVLRLQASLHGLPQLGPWDLFAPCPSIGSTHVDERTTFAEGIAIIADAYAGIDPAMGAFVHMMADNRWIEGRVGPAKRPGAYCTSFAKSRSPRVYMTYTGGMRELKTLAHELGHGLHSWVMRDMPLVQTHYPMTLAETASIFGETVVNHALIAKAKAAGDPAAQLSWAWAQAREVEAMLLNIPARFTFEQELYERRQESTLSPKDLKQLMSEHWAEWYGDTLSEMDPMFWASKLHFSIAGLSFYNFPYTFGYLFALGVYAQREQLGSGFYRAYVALLRDTGRMTAEELAQKHLGVDLTQPAFWEQSLAVARRSVDQFAAAVREVRAAR